MQRFLVATTATMINKVRKFKTQVKFKVKTSTVTAT